MAEVSRLMSSYGQRHKNEVIQNGRQHEDDHRLVRKEKNVEDKLLEALRSKPNFDPHNTEGMCMTYFYKNSCNSDKKMFFVDNFCRLLHSDDLF